MLKLFCCHRSSAEFFRTNSTTNNLFIRTGRSTSCRIFIFLYGSTGGMICHRNFCLCKCNNSASSTLFTVCKTSCCTCCSLTGNCYFSIDVICCRCQSCNIRVTTIGTCISCVTAICTCGIGYSCNIVMLKSRGTFLCFVNKSAD